MDLPTKEEELCPACWGTGHVIDLQRLGGQLKEIRERAGLSMRDLAERLKVSAQQVSDLERGLRRPSMATLAAYLRIAPRE